MKPRNDNTNTTNPLSSAQHPWTEDPLVAYQNYLKYAGKGVNAGVMYNRAVITMFGAPSSEKNNELEVHAHNGEFYPLNTVMRMPAYCSKVTIRNLHDVVLLFKFSDNIISGILGMQTDSRKLGQNVRVAYRNIVPSEFSQATSLAGPMGFHEFLIDGEHYQGNNKLLEFIANSDFNATPILIVLENCKGVCEIKGLDAAKVERIFENKCTPDLLTFNIVPPVADENKEESPRHKP
jgi:hypothetical protein